MNEPSVLSVIRPNAVPDWGTADSTALSTSMSFARMFPDTGVSSAVTKTSSTAIGGVRFTAGAAGASNARRSWAAAVAGVGVDRVGGLGDTGQGGRQQHALLERLEQGLARERDGLAAGCTAAGVEETARATAEPLQRLQQRNHGDPFPVTAADPLLGSRSYPPRAQTGGSRSSGRSPSFLQGMSYPRRRDHANPTASGDIAKNRELAGSMDE